jgi:hypothetical protein
VQACFYAILVGLMNLTATATLDSALGTGLPDRGAAGQVKSESAAPAPEEGNRAKALALLGRYAENQARLRSFRYVLETSSEIQVRASAGPYRKLNGESRKLERAEFRSDGRRFSVRWQTWGNVKSATEFLAEDRCPYNSLLWDGQTFIECVATTDTPGRVEIDTRRNESRYRELMRENPLWCRWSGGRPADELLRRAISLSLRTNMELVAEAKCHVLDAVAADAKYSVWLDPDRGHNIVKATITYVRDGVSYGLDHVLCTQTADVWIPMEGQIRQSRSFPNGDSTRSVEQLKVSELTLNPDHVALRSFVPDDVKNGAWVTINTQRGQLLNPRTVPLWRDGQVVDRTGRVIMSVTTDRR